MFSFRWWRKSGHHVSVTFEISPHPCPVVTRGGHIRTDHVSRPPPGRTVSRRRFRKSSNTRPVGDSRVRYYFIDSRHTRRHNFRPAMFALSDVLSTGRGLRFPDPRPPQLVVTVPAAVIVQFPVWNVPSPYAWWSPFPAPVGVATAVGFAPPTYGRVQSGHVLGQPGFPLPAGGHVLGQPGHVLGQPGSLLLAGGHAHGFHPFNAPFPPLRRARCTGDCCVRPPTVSPRPSNAAGAATTAGDRPVCRAAAGAGAQTPKPQHACSTCVKPFASLNYLKRHLRTASHRQMLMKERQRKGVHVRSSI